MSDTYDDDEYQADDGETPTTLEGVMAKTKKDFSELLQSFDRLKPLIDVEGDYKVTHDAEEMIKQRYHQREAQEAEIASELERLRHVLEESRQAAMRPATAGTEEQHLDEAAQMESEYYHAQKRQMSEENKLASRKEMTVNLQKALAEAEGTDVEATVKDDLGEAKQLRKFRELGLRYIADGTEKVLITLENDVDYVSIDNDQSDYYRTNTIWNKINTMLS